MDGNTLVGYVKQFHKTVFRLAYSYVRNRENAEDICQEAFVKLLDYRGEFSSDEDCKRWLMRVVINLSKNLLKSFSYSRTEELSEDIPLETAEDGELLALVKTLPIKYGEVIHLFYYEGYSVKEIADILSISQTAVTSRLSRGREKLKSLLTEGTGNEQLQKTFRTNLS